MLNSLTHHFRSKSKRFKQLCESNQLQLDYRLNRDQLDLLESIFLKREYADYFPFYKQATIVDIGAHFGYFSIFAQQNTSEHSQLISLEPSSFNFTNFQKNLASNQITNVTALNRALGANPGRTTLHLGESTNHSILPEYPSGKQISQDEEVNVCTLGSLIDEFKLSKIDFLKMDCEGAEYEILDELSDETWEKIVVLSMEFHDLKRQQRTGNSLLSVLKEQDFEVVRFHYEPTSMNLNYGKLIALNKKYH